MTVGCLLFDSRSVIPLAHQGLGSVHRIVEDTVILCFRCSNLEIDFLGQELENNYLCNQNDVLNYLWIPRLVRRVASGLGFENRKMLFEVMSVEDERASMLIN